MTNTTILLIGHGSRAESGNLEVWKFSEQWRALNPNWHIQVCFIEFATPLLEEGLNQAAQSASKVVVVPLILNAAGHVKLEIPEALNQARKRSPEVEFIYAKHLGVNEEIKAVMLRRLKHVSHQLQHPDPKTTGVILLGRGSSDPAANAEVAKLARLLFEASEYDRVEIGFTGITYPRLEAQVQSQVQLGVMQLIILPYYLFDGRLIQRIKEQVKQLTSQYPQIRFGLADYIGFEEEIFILMGQRVQGCLENRPEARLECDSCPAKAPTSLPVQTKSTCTHAPI